MVIDFHVDSCKWVDGSLKNKLMDILKHDMIKYGNSFTPCPQYVSCEYVLKQLLLSVIYSIKFDAGTRLYEKHDF